MKPDVKAAWIGSLSSLTIAIISVVGGYFITVKQQTAQPDPVVIREPYIVIQKEIIREYYNGNKRFVKNNDITIDTPLPKTEEQQVKKVEDSSDAVEIMDEKKIGIYYSYGNKNAKSIANLLVGRMKAKGLDATFYSIGRVFSKPDVPSGTYLFGLDSDINTSDFIKSFKEIFQFTGEMNPNSGQLKNKPIIDNDTWQIKLDKDYYIIIGK